MNFYLGFLEDFVLIPGQIEEWNILIDLNGLSIFSIPEDLKIIIYKIQLFFNFRLGNIYLINSNYFSKILFNLAGNLLISKLKNRLFLINSSNNFSELFENINRNQLEIKYGGTCENLKFNVFNYEKNSKNFSFEKIQKLNLKIINNNNDNYNNNIINS